MQIDRFTIVSIVYALTVFVVFMSIGIYMPQYIRYFPCFGLIAGGIMMAGAHISVVVKKRKEVSKEVS